MIPSDSLRPLHRLRHLDLRSNNISFISEDAFVGFGDSITFLNLQKNEWVLIEWIEIDRVQWNFYKMRKFNMQITFSILRSIFAFSNWNLDMASRSHLNKLWEMKKFIIFCVFTHYSIKSVPSMVFENLNSLETLNIQNNKLTRIPADVMDPIVDTLRVVDITGKHNCVFFTYLIWFMCMCVYLCVWRVKLSKYSHFLFSRLELIRCVINDMKNNFHFMVDYVHSIRHRFLRGGVEFLWWKKKLVASIEIEIDVKINSYPR